MKRLHACQLAALLFFVVCYGFFVANNLLRPRILILHSYADDYAWVRDIDIGLRHILNSPSTYSVRWNYMDLKRHADPAFRQRARNEAQKEIESWQPDILIAVDDDAQQLVAQVYVNHPKLKIIHAGINGEANAYGYDKADNVAGILERKPLPAIRQALLELARLNLKDRPAPRILNLGDRSSSVLADEKFLRQFDWAPATLVGSRLVASFDEWKAAVNEANHSADIILVSNYRQLAVTPGSRQFVPARTVMAWTEANARSIVLGMNGFNVEDGAAIAVTTSPFEQGEVAAQYALAILLDKKSPATLPATQTRQFLIYLRESALRARRLQIPPTYESFARANNSYFP